MAQSWVKYTSDGYTKVLNVPFKYLDRSHVYVYFDGDPVGYSWIDSSTIELVSVPPEGTSIAIERHTPYDARFINFVKKSMLREVDLDRDSNQMFYIVQEIHDNMEAIVEDYIENIGQDVLEIDNLPTQRITKNAYHEGHTADQYLAEHKVANLVFEVDDSSLSWPEVPGGVYTTWYSDHRAVQRSFYTGVGLEHERTVTPETYPNWSAWKTKEIYSSRDVDTLLTKNAPAQAGADKTIEHTSNNTLAVGSQNADQINASVVNFSNRNDRNGTAPVAPTVPSDGSAIDHVSNTDGSVDMSFEWTWSGTQADIDGFVVYVRGSTSGETYTISGESLQELSYFVQPHKRTFFMYGCPANKYFTIGVCAYRVVDPDVNSNGIVYSPIAQSTFGAENPYRPSDSVEFGGNLTGSVAGTPAATVKADIQQALDDAAAAQSTADNKIKSFYQDGEPASGMSEGDLWFDTNDGNEPYVYQNSAWVSAKDSDIANALDTATDAQATADGKVTTFFSTSEPTPEGVGDLWYNPNTYTFKRWDGSTWNLVSDITGENTAKDIINQGDLATSNTANWGSQVVGRPLTFEVVSQGWTSATHPKTRGVYDDDGNLIYEGGRMYTLSVLDRSTRTWDSHTSYSPYDDTTEALDMRNALNALGSDKIVVVHTWNEPQKNRVFNALHTALYRCGACRSIFESSNFKQSSAYILVGVPGIGEGNGLELYSGETDNDEDAWVNTVFTVDTAGRIQMGATKIRDAVDISYSDGSVVNDLKPAAAGSMVNSPTIGVRKNTKDFDVASNGLAYIHGFDAAGNPADVDGFIAYEGQALYVPRTESGKLYTVGQNFQFTGYIMFDTTKSKKWTVGGVGRSIVLTAYFQGDWHLFDYDSEGTTIFTPTDTDVIIGTWDGMSGTAGLFKSIQVWSQAMDVGAVPETQATNNLYLVQGQTTWTDETLTVYDSNNVLRVKIGKL